MMDHGILPGIVGGVIATLIGLYFVKKARQRSTNGELFFGQFMFITGALCACSAVICIVVSLVGYAIEDSGDVVAAVALIIAFSLGATYFLLEYFKVQGTYDDSSITFTTPWSGTTSASFTDLTNVKFNALAYWYVLSFKDGSRMRISSYLLGHGDLIEKLKSLGHEIE